jgi:hypothetical protein
MLRRVVGTAVLALLVVPTMQDGLPKVAEDGSIGYDAKFFADGLKTADVAPVLARQLRKFMPEPDSSIVDVGCGNGLLVSALRETGQTAYCLEGSIEAKGMWPEPFLSYYHIVDLTSKAAMDVMPTTDYVCTFEVAEHLAPEYADHFVALLTKHKPKLVFFGAATEFQDRGQNPTHVNENSFAYWIAKFKEFGYALDLAKSATLRHQLLIDETLAKRFGRAWWWPKNMLVFASLEHTSQAMLDAERQQMPAHIDMLSDTYTKLGYGRIGGNKEFGEMWERDWKEFGQLFHAQNAHPTTKQEDFFSQFQHKEEL